MPMQTDYSDAPAAAVEGMIACRLLDAEIMSCFNGDSGEILFGRGVESASATDHRSVKLPNAETDKIIGFTCRTHSIDPGDRGELDDTLGVAIGGSLNVMVKGTLWVKVRTGCAPYERLWVRCTASPGAVGTAENADDGTETIDCTGSGRFVSYAAADGLAKLAVDFTNA